MLSFVQAKIPVTREEAVVINNEGLTQTQVQQTYHEKEMFYLNLDV